MTRAELLQAWNEDLSDEQRALLKAALEEIRAMPVDEAKVVLKAIMQFAAEHGFTWPLKDEWGQG